MYVTAAGDVESEDDPQADAPEESDAEVVSEEVAEQMHTASMAFQNAKSKYHEAVKGRGIDRDELRKRNNERLRLAKARSYCGVCKRKGRWHKDPECPLRGSAPPKPADNTVKSAQMTHHVQMCFLTNAYEVDDADVSEETYGGGAATYETDGADVLEETYGGDVVNEVFMVKYEKVGKYIRAIRDKGKGKGKTSEPEPMALHPTPMLAIVDTACTKTVAGHQWYEEYCTWADARGFPIQLVEEKDNFRFGASRVHPSLFAVWAYFGISGKFIQVKVAVVQCRVPLLFSREVLAKLGMVYRAHEQSADLIELKLEGVKMQVSTTGHPALVVSDFPDTSCLSGALWTEDPEVCLNNGAGIEQYFAAAGGEGDTFVPYSKPLFFPKKVLSEVKNFLMHPNLAVNSFFMWRSRANQSRDFWVETETEMIRIHAVPRKESFNPAKWNTSLETLKSQLLSCIGQKRITEAIPCHGSGIQHSTFDDVWHTHHESYYAQVGGLWIGRSRFPKMTISSDALVSERPVLLCDAKRPDFAMEHEQGGPDLGAAGIGCAHPSEVDGTRTETDVDRATPTDEQRRDREQGGDRFGKALSTGSQEEVRGGEVGVASQGNAGADDQTLAGPRPAGRGSSDDLREVQALALPRSPRGVHDLGNPRDGSQPELGGGLGEVCGLVQEGAGASRGEAEEEWSGADKGGSRGQCNPHSPSDGAGIKLSELRMVKGVFQSGQGQAPGREELAGEHGHGSASGGSGGVLEAGDADGTARRLQSCLLHIASGKHSAMLSFEPMLSFVVLPFTRLPTGFKSKACHQRCLAYHFVLFTGANMLALKATLCLLFTLRVATCALEPLEGFYMYIFSWFILCLCYLKNVFFKQEGWFPNIGFHTCAHVAPIYCQCLQTQNHTKMMLP